MKANFLNRKLPSLFVTLAALGAASFAAAGNDKDDDPTRGKDGPYSEVGLATGLPLYDKDAADACVAGALQIRVNVHNVTPVGILKLELFGEQDFMKSKGKLRRIRVPAAASPQKVCINLPAPGSFAVVGYHDKNGNRKLKKAWNFKPLEPYGLSNNPDMKSLRLPKYSETGFDVPMNGVDIDINLVDLTKDD